MAPPTKAALPVRRHHGGPAARRGVECRPWTTARFARLRFPLSGHLPYLWTFFLAFAVAVAVSLAVPLSVSRSLTAAGAVVSAVTRLLAAAGASVRLGSRSVERAQSACQRVREHVESGTLQPVEAGRWRRQ